MLTPASSNRSAGDRSARWLHSLYPIAAGAIIAALTALLFWLAERYVR